MIAYIKGDIVYFTDSSVIVDVNGVGYEVTIPVSQINDMGSPGEQIVLHTHMQVKEDDMSLFGFIDRDDLYIFKKLITVSGVGPKSAIGLLAIMDANGLYLAIAQEDADQLAKAPGIGKKMAQKIILELKDKIVGKSAPIKTLFRQNSDMTMDAKQEAIEALMALGYQQKEILHVFAHQDITNLDTESLVKFALKQLAKF